MKRRHGKNNFSENGQQFSKKDVTIRNETRDPEQL